MCGRFALGSSADELLEQVRSQYSPSTAGFDDSNIPPERSVDATPEASTSTARNFVYEHGFRTANYNVAPRTRVPVLRQLEEYEGKLAAPQLESMTWGLVPHFMKQKPEYSDQLKTINARDDTILSGQGMWQSIKGKRRGVIFVDGFYEWLKKGNTKIPHFTKRKDGKLMALACLWDSVHFEDEDEFPLHSFTIITTDSNKQLNFLHDRMPVILDSQEDVSVWMDVSKEGFPASVSALMKPYEGKLDCYPVSQDVGNVRNNNSDFIIPVSERKGNIASFFSKTPTKASPSKGSDSKVVSSSTAHGSAKRKRSASPTPSVDPKLVGNQETNAPLPTEPASPIKPSVNETPDGKDKKRKKVDTTGDANLAKASKNKALDSFFGKESK